MSRLTSALVLLCAATAALAEPTYPCFRAAVAPVIDGVVTDDPAWADVPGVTGFYALGGDYTVAKQSTARACYDDANLYVAVACEEPDIAEVQNVMKDGDGVWAEASIEFFVEPGRGGPVFQLGVSAAGARSVGSGSISLDDWRAAAHKAEDHYSVELAVPLKALGEDISSGGWHVAFCRNIWTYTSGGDKFTAWPALARQFREPASFALLQVLDQVASPERRAAAEQTLNAEYRAHLVAQVRALAPAAGEYLDVLRQAAGDEDNPQRSEARGTVTTWRGVQRLAQGAADAPMAELRQAAALAAELQRRSYQLKYEYLIEVLLRG